MVIVGIIFIFKKQITSIINSIFSSIKDQVNDI
ncbi:MAG: hypothetical protein K6B67_09995 [Lachnospiraceae bacterium]|nr:hypothetical protein [Lachnospiraceae bacterium]